MRHVEGELEGLEGFVHVGHLRCPHKDWGKVARDEANKMRHRACRHEECVRDEHTLQQFLEQVLTREREAREERRIKTALNLSGLSLAKTLEDYDFALQRGVDRNHIDLLATCTFAKRKENILFLGPPGVGKSDLAQAFGIKAIQNGFSVTFVNADHLIDKMRRDEANPNRRLHRRKFMSAAVLIIDELGFQAFDRKDAYLLFKVISYRYERSSTIITRWDEEAVPLALQHHPRARLAPALPPEAGPARHAPSFLQHPAITSVDHAYLAALIPSIYANNPSTNLDTTAALLPGPPRRRPSRYCATEGEGARATSSCHRFNLGQTDPEGESRSRLWEVRCARQP